MFIENRISHPYLTNGLKPMFCPDKLIFFQTTEAFKNLFALTDVFYPARSHRRRRPLPDWGALS
ncbi:MAG TPA: hypothetical protein VG324_23730, partial [Blastocatellia bacterium]|nr:hypothetical protein [Blastocatellia bacterium]